MKTARGERRSACAMAAFVSRELSRPQNHPVTLRGTRAENPNNRRSKNIAGKPPRRFNCRPKHKAYWFPGRVCHFSSDQIPFPSASSPYWFLSLSFYLSFLPKSIVYTECLWHIPIQNDDLYDNGTH